VVDDPMDVDRARPRHPAYQVAADAELAARLQHAALMRSSGHAAAQERRDSDLVRALQQQALGSPAAGGGAEDVQMEAAPELPPYEYIGETASACERRRFLNTHIGGPGRTQEDGGSNGDQHLSVRDLQELAADLNYGFRPHSPRPESGDESVTGGGNAASRSPRSFAQLAAGAADGQVQAWSKGVGTRQAASPKTRLQQQQAKAQAEAAALKGDPPSPSQQPPTAQPPRKLPRVAHMAGAPKPDKQYAAAGPVKRFQRLGLQAGPTR